ncbi:hypothetical protein HG537_0F03770 [Torulaspora globosa]|uniref:ATP-dependent DNA helicase n=1 Tax=Torulaspora globosa TaxID=48254 RepID=A0A7H9HYG5_9SACH|nr:hypothetical protein HG537_0F03770 [Torulaspora sp. CBS 2947]
MFTVMANVDENYDDLNDEELECLHAGSVNKTVRTTVIRKPKALQTYLNGRIIEGQQAFYEEIRNDITFGPTHHKLCHENLQEFIYPTNFEVREYQFDIVQKALFQNVLCAIPTGMGKTFIASTVMLNFFRWSQSGKIIFTAPTRPLVAQQIKACLGITGIPQDQTAILLDKSRKNREQIWNQKRVFFTTPQVVENDLKRGTLHPKEVICIVLDEAHRATGSYAYTNIIKFISRFNTSYRVLALTATPGSDLVGVQEVVKNLEISKVEARTEESIDIMRYMRKKDRLKIEVSIGPEIEDLIEQIGVAVLPILKQAVELDIYEDCQPSQINAFKAMQQSQKIIANPSIPEGVKWRNFFILQLLNHVGQMLKRIKIYGVNTFYNYFLDKYREFTTKYNLGKSTNKIAAEFYFNPILITMMKSCETLLANPNFLGHPKLHHVREELTDFFSEDSSDSRVIIFTELRESALEIVKCVDLMNGPGSNYRIRPHIFIGQAKGKEGFDEVTFTRKNQPKGRKKADRTNRQEEDKQFQEQKKQKKKEEQLERDARRTGSSEDAQIKGMTQKQQKEVIQKFKAGEYNVLVCTSIGEEGLDIGEVDLIICYDTTSSPIKNIQRMGRTGRKRDGKIVLLFSSNESLKFEQALKDYYGLQKLLCQNHLQYTKSDRIIPPNIKPVCRKEHISIDEEALEVNEMDDTEEVIRYATQCMLGKKPKAKKRAKGKEAKREKRFFMPDNVDGGIVTAMALVTKTKMPGNRLDDDTKTKQTIQCTENASVENASNAKHQPKDVVLTELARLATRMELPSIIKRASKKVKDEQDAETPKVTSDASDGINLSRKIDDEELSAPASKRQKSISIETKSSFSNDKLSDKGTYERNHTGLLTNSEREYFLQHYSPDDSVSIGTIPNFLRGTKCAQINHSILNQKILQLFEDLRQNKTHRTIEMNRTKCIARGIHNGIIQQNHKHASVMVKSDSYQTSELRHSTKTDLPAKEADDLDSLLSSDSDF